MHTYTCWKTAYPYCAVKVQYTLPVPPSDAPFTSTARVSPSVSAASCVMCSTTRCLIFFAAAERDGKRVTEAKTIAPSTQTSSTDECVYIHGYAQPHIQHHSIVFGEYNQYYSISYNKLLNQH